MLRRLRPTLFFAGLVLGAALPGRAQDPVLQGLTPGAIAPGTTTTLQINGSNLAPARKVWTSFPCETALADGIEKNGENPAQVTYRFTLPADAACGIHGLRLVTDKGVSPLRFLIVDDLPSVASTGGNTSRAAAQAVTVPTAIDGAVPNQGWQYFKFSVTAGQRLAFEVVARRMGSSLDPMLRLLDASGRELAFNDDTPGLSGDAIIAHTFKDAGEYVVEMRDIKYGAGAYRLRIGDFPVATVAYPLAVQRGVATPVTLAGFHVEGLAPLNLTVAADDPAEWKPISLKRPGGASGFSTVAVSPRPQFLEQEPNNAPEQSNRISLDQDVNGRLEQKGDVDRFVFTATKDQTATFTGITRQQGSPTDLNFRILNKDGGQVAAAEDSGVNEGSLNFKAPADGDYTLVVEDLNRRGGSEHAYRIAVSATAPPFSLASSLDTFNLPVGGVATATVTSVRTGYTGPIELKVQNLPAGVSASPSVIGAGRNDAVLTIQAPADFAVGDLHGIQIVGTARIGETDVAIPAETHGVLKARNNNMRWAPEALAGSIAASAAPAPGFTWRAEPAEVVFGKDLSAKVKLIGTRAAGFEEAITVALNPPQNGVPGGITVAVKNIDKGQTEAEITVSGNNQAPLGDFTVGLTGTLKQGDKTAVQGLALRLKLSPPLSIQLDPAGGKIAKGGELILKAVVQRNPAFSGPVNVSLQNLPAGVTAAAATIAADQTSVELKLTATAEAAAATVANLTVKAEAMIGSAKFETMSSPAPLAVE